MNFKEEDGKNEIEKLVNIHRTLNKQYLDKKELIKKLTEEVNELKLVINQLNKVISGKSFTTASNLLSAEDLFKESIGSKGSGTLIKRKLFSKNNDLLCILKFLDFKKVEILFVEPEKIDVREKSEIFINDFIQQILIKIKENEPRLEMKIDKCKNLDSIQRIEINNVSKLEYFDLIEFGIRKVLNSKF